MSILLYTRTQKSTLQLFHQTSLESLVLKDNFYQILDSHLDIHFLYSKTKKYYAFEDQESIDHVVFFKILIVGYLNYINNDRARLKFYTDNLSILLFLDYNVGYALSPLGSEYLNKFSIK